ncbi:MAG: TetR/AcrR family transcriptional regulator [Hyphomicrobiales bacterium]
MKNKELQESRMKGYFIDAAKEILKSEGIRAISVRNVAEKAGYSFATLYNYFRDINDLVFLCINDFQSECKEYVLNDIDNSLKGRDRLKSLLKSYIKYFVEYPGIFELFYLVQVGGFGNKNDSLKIIDNSIYDICGDSFEYLLEGERLNNISMEDLKTQVQLCVVGLLVIYINRNVPEDYRDFIARCDRQLDILI